MFHRHDSTQGPATAGLVIHWASRYELLIKLLFLGKEQAFREATLDLVPLEKAGQAVLDVGCGPGSLALAAKKRVGVGRVCGIDPAPEMIALARQKARRALMSVELEVGVIEKLPFEDATFDVVLSSLMLHHLPDELQQRGIAELHRVLRPGGICLVVDIEMHGHGLKARLRGHLVGHGIHHGREASTGTLMEDAGFDVTTGPTIHRLIRFSRGVKPS